jgi:hypothetical protein
MQFTIRVWANNDQFEYWSSNYLGYTMSYTSACLIAYFAKIENDSRYKVIANRFITAYRSV